MSGHLFPELTGPTRTMSMPRMAIATTRAIGTMIIKTTIAATVMPTDITKIKVTMMTTTTTATTVVTTSF